MPIPSFVKFFRPVLDRYKDGERRFKDVADDVGEFFNLSEEEKRELTPSRRQTKLLNRVSWAKTYLINAGLLRTTERGYSKITDEGLKVLESQDEIDIKYLERFDSFQEFKDRGTDTSKDKNETPEVIDERSLTPEEGVEQNFNTVQKSLADELLSRIHGEKPQLFESLIVDLFTKMGYGIVGEITGRPGDGGVDGVIHQDRLGIDKIYLQAKLYAPENKITDKQIREFGGAIRQKQVEKGVFVTTSLFTDGACDTAKDLNITLIDGYRLAYLMIEYDVGCQTVHTYEIKKIDEDYFN